MTTPRHPRTGLQASARGVLGEVLDPASYRAVVSRAKCPVAAVLISYSLLNFGLTAVLSQLLGSRHFGEYAVVITIAGIFRLLASLSLEGSMAKFIAESGERDPAGMKAFYGAGLATRLAAGLAALLLAAACARWLTGLYHVPHLAPTLAAAACYLCLLAPVAGFFLSCIQGREQPSRWSTATLANAFLVFPAAVIGALGFARWGLTGMLLCFAAGWALAAFVSGLFARRAMGFTWAPPDAAHLRLLLAFVAPLWFGDLISQGAHVVLKSYLAVKAGPVPVGQFEIAVSLLFQVGTLYSAIMIVFLPTWARLYAAERGAELLESFTRARAVIIGIAAFIGFGIALTGQWLIPLIFGRDQLGAVPAARVMGLLMPLTFSSWVTLSTFVISNRTSLSARANILWFCIVVPLGLALIPALGSLGCSLAFLVAYIAFCWYVITRARPFFATLRAWAQREAEASRDESGAAPVGRPDPSG
ncbi:MAG: lipopolysaccharide biosynthesis protein [Armatimonadota bacterium]